MTKSRADMFLSHKAEDRARLQPVDEAPEADGIAIWWDAQHKLDIP